MTTEHLQQACPLQDNHRRQFWPVEITVARKLFGSLGDLQYDNRTSSAGMSTTQHPQASLLAGGDYTVARKLFGSLEDLQYDNRTSSVGMSTTRHPQVSVLAGGDYDGQEAFSAAWRTCGMTTEHLLQACPLHDNHRRQFWPVETMMARKFFQQPVGSAAHSSLCAGNRGVHFECWTRRPICGFISVFVGRF